MGFLDDLFGGGGTDISMVDPYAGPQRDLMNSYANWLQPQVGQGVSAYSGQITPDANQLQQQAFGLAGGMNPLAQQMQGYAQNIMNNPNQGYLGMANQGYQQMMQPYDQSMAMASIEPAQQFAMQRFQSDIMPMIAEKYGAQLGSKDAGAIWRSMGRAAGDMQANIGAQLGQNIFTGQQNQMDRQLQAIGMAPQLQGAPMQLAGQAAGYGSDMMNQMLGAGGQQYGINAAQNQEAYNKWAYEQPYNNPYLQYMQTAFGMPGQNIVSQQQGPGLGSQLLGGAMGAAGSFLGTETGASWLQNPELFGWGFS